MSVGRSAPELSQRDNPPNSLKPTNYIVLVCRQVDKPVINLDSQESPLLCLRSNLGEVPAQAIEYSTWHIVSLFPSVFCCGTRPRQGLAVEIFDASHKYSPRSSARMVCCRLALQGSRSGISPAPVTESSAAEFHRPACQSSDNVLPRHDTTVWEICCCAAICQQRSFLFPSKRPVPSLQGRTRIALNPDQILPAIIGNPHRYQHQSRRMSRRTRIAP